MVMSSGSQRISRYFPLLLAQELNYLPCKLLWLFSLSIIFAGLKLFLQLIVLSRRYLTIFSVAPLQHNLYIPSALVGVFYPYNRGALFTALVVIYALTSGIAGYIATAFYCQLEGTNWVCTAFTLCVCDQIEIVFSLMVVMLHFASIYR